MAEERGQIGGEGEKTGGVLFDQPVQLFTDRPRDIEEIHRAGAQGRHPLIPLVVLRIFGLASGQIANAAEVGGEIRAVPQVIPQIQRRQKLPRSV